jgi:tRNA G18 (ribose-2'-O)-methylase SpoU
MKKPVPKNPAGTPAKIPGKSTPLPIPEIVGKMSDTVGAISGLLGEMQKTKQVVVNAEVEKFKSREETHRTLVKAGERHHELDNAELDSQRRHQQAMAEVQLRAEQYAIERDLIRQRVEKDITVAEDRIVPPLGGQE